MITDCAWDRTEGHSISHEPTEIHDEEQAPMGKQRLEQMLIETTTLSCLPELVSGSIFGDRKRCLKKSYYIFIMQKIISSHKSVLGYSIS